MSDTKLHYSSAGVWNGSIDMNAGDPLNPWPTVPGATMTWSLAGYQQSINNYISTDPNTHTLSLGAGHLALILDDGISANNIGARLAGIDIINGGSGGQIIDLTSPTLKFGNVTINAGSGNDILMGNMGNETINGKAGNDYIWGGSGQDSLYGGSGNDSIYAGGNGADKLYGGSGDDSLVAGNGNQALYGGSGNDTVVAGMGNQTLDGGAGHNTLDLTRLAGTLDIEAGKTLTVTTAKGAVLSSTIVSFDTIIGNNGNNQFDTSQNGGTFIGGTGNDLFHSESGASKLTGGGGNNVYQYEKLFVALHPANSDTVTDFHVGSDHLDLADFLKGVANPAKPGHFLGAANVHYSDVVHLVDNAAGTMVEVEAKGVWYNAVELNGIHQAATVDATHFASLTDLLLA